jgi:hypothetical protein
MLTRRQLAETLGAAVLYSPSPQLAENRPLRGRRRMLVIRTRPPNPRIFKTMCGIRLQADYSRLEPATKVLKPR